MPLRQFRYDAKNDILKCPRGKVLKSGKPIAHGCFFSSRARDVPRPAAMHPPRGAIHGSKRIDEGTQFVVSLAVGTPLIDIAEHVIKPKVISLLLPDPTRLSLLMVILLSCPI